MGRYTVGVLLLSACAGCGSQAKSSSGTPVVDPQRVNAEVSGYVKLAREYLSRKEFDKAVQTLERAVAIESATDKREATELLAAVLPLTLKTTQPKAVKSERYSASMGPVEVVQGYLSSSTWQERVPFVLRPTETGPLMASVYKNHGFDPSMFRPGEILPLEKESVPVGSQLTLTVDVSESSPENPFWKYVLERTAEGYKIDWEASQALKWADEEAAARRALQLDNPELEVRLLKAEPQGNYVYLHFRVTNRSNKYLSSWSIALELSDGSGDYVGQETFAGSHLPAGESSIEKHILASQIWRRTSSRRFTVKYVSIDLGGQKSQNATKYFTVKEARQ